MEGREGEMKPKQRGVARKRNEKRQLVTGSLGLSAESASGEEKLILADY